MVYFNVSPGFGGVEEGPCTADCVEKVGFLKLPKD